MRQSISTLSVDNYDVLKPFEFIGTFRGSPELDVRGSRIPSPRMLLKSCFSKTMTVSQSVTEGDMPDIALFLFRDIIVVPVGG